MKIESHYGTGVGGEASCGELVVGGGVEGFVGSAFYGKDDVVVGVIRIAEGFDRTHPSIVAETEGFRTFLQGSARQSRGENQVINRFKKS